MPSGPFFKTFFICRFIDLRSVASLSDAERTTEDALRRELLVNLNAKLSNKSEFVKE